MMRSKLLTPPSKVVPFFWFVTRPFLGVAVLTIIIVILHAFLSQSLTLFFKWIVEAIEQNNVEQALWYGLLFPVAIFCVQLVMRLSSYTALHWLPLSRQYANDTLTAYTFEHSRSFFADRFAGSLLTKVNNVVNAVESLMHDFLWSYVSLIISLCVSLYFISTVDMLAAGLFFALVVFLVLSNRLLMPGKKVRSRKAAAAASKMRGTIVDTFSNISITRSHAAFQDENTRVQKESAEWTKLARANWIYTEYTQLLNTAIIFVFGLGMFWVLVDRWENNFISSAEFIFILAIFAQLSNSLVFIGRMMVNAARVAGEMEEGLRELIVPRQIVDVPNAQQLRVDSGVVDFKKVAFTFESQHVFTDFNLQINAGQRIGLVGSSGAGKSTLVGLLMREYDLSSGQIYIDNQDIAKVTQDSLRAAIAVVPQEPALFHRTIRENIAYGKPDASDEEIIEVAKKAYAHTFISALPQGYDTLVGERGVKLSGGQKQRIAIARAMLKDAPILVLDEATSALDSESEVEIQKALHGLMVGKTVIAIAHRLSTLREMDRIIVLDQGQIVEDGTHEALLTYNGIYARLWQHQAGGFMTDDVPQ